MVGMIDFSQVDPNGANALARGFMASQDRQNQMQQQARANKLADLQYNSANRAEQNALAEEQVYKNNQDPAQIAAQLRAAGLGKQAMVVEKSQAEQHAARLSRLKDTASLMEPTAAWVMKNPQSAEASVRAFGQMTGTDVTADLAEIASFNGNPDLITKWASTHAMKAKDLLTQYETKDTGGSITRTGYDPVTGASVGTPTILPKTIDPGTAAQIASREKEAALDRANRLQVAKTRVSRTGAQGLSSIEDDALAQAILDGRVDINKVNSRNAKLLASAVLKDPTANLKEMSFENFGAAAGSRALGTQSAKMVAASSEASKMIPIAQKYVEKVSPSDYPIVNAAGNYVAAKTGDPNVAGLAATLNALVNSYSRAINPTGNPTVSDKNHAREIINTAMAKGQFNEVFTVMQQEMEAAKQSPVEASAILKGQRGKPAPANPGIDALLDKYK